MATDRTIIINSGSTTLISTIQYHFLRENEIIYLNTPNLGIKETDVLSVQFIVGREIKYDMNGRSVITLTLIFLLGVAVFLIYHLQWMYLPGYYLWGLCMYIVKPVSSYASFPSPSWQMILYLRRCHL